MIDTLGRAIVEGLNISKFIETGTYKGETVAQVGIWFSELHPLRFGQIERLIVTGAKAGNPWNTLIPYPVFKKGIKGGRFKIYSVDNDSELVKTATGLFASNPNIILKCQSSEKFIEEMISNGTLHRGDNCLFFLDAHSGKAYLPLRDEIKQILRLKRFAIMIDDFQVPSRLEFGYNTRVGGVFDWKFIKDLFADREISTYYPIRSNRDNRGWILIVGGYSKEQLAFLKRLPVIKGDIWTRLTQPLVIRYKDHIERRGKAQTLVKLGIRVLQAYKNFRNAKTRVVKDVTTVEHFKESHFG